MSKPPRSCVSGFISFNMHCPSDRLSPEPINLPQQTFLLPSFSLAPLSTPHISPPPYTSFLLFLQKPFFITHQPFLQLFPSPQSWIFTFFHTAQLPILIPVTSLFHFSYTYISLANLHPACIKEVAGNWSTTLLLHSTGILTISNILLNSNTGKSTSTPQQFHMFGCVFRTNCLSPLYWPALISLPNLNR